MFVIAVSLHNFAFNLNEVHDYDATRERRFDWIAFEKVLIELIEIKWPWSDWCYQSEQKCLQITSIK